MNAQADDAACSAQDSELLRTVDHILESRGVDNPDNSTALEGYAERLARAVPRADPAFQEMLGRRLAVEVERRGRRRFPRLRIPRPVSPLRPFSALLALLVVVGGVGGYLRLQSPTPVDARTLLNRVAAVSPGPGEAVHETFRLSATGGVSGSSDVWIAADANGSPARFALTQSVRGGSSGQDESGRLVQTPDLLEVYDPSTDTVIRTAPGVTVRASDSGPTVQDLEGMLVGTMVAQKLSRALSSGTRPGSFQLAQQTLDGVSVYALELEGTNLQTFYFNAQSYILEGADWMQGSRSWQARLDPASYRTMPIGSVPSSTFSLNAPATAHVDVLPAPTKSGSQDQTVTSMAAACNTTAETITAALQSGSRSLLDICRQTAPSMTADQLVTALVAPYKSQLDAQVASGAMTPAQEATDLSNLRTKLTTMVTGQAGPAGAPPKQP